MKIENLRDLPLSFVVKGEKITLKDKRVTEGEKSQEGIFTTQDFIIPDYNLKIVAYYKYYDKYDASEWYFRFINHSSVYTPVISNLYPCDMDMEHEAGTNYQVHYATGGYCSKNDFEPYDYDEAGEFKIYSEGGRSSGKFMPFFNFRHTKAQYMVGIGWSGSWEAGIDFPGGRPDLLNMKIGMPETNFYLFPGENVRTPKVLIMSYEGQVIDGQNKLRRHIFENHNHYKNVTGKDDLPTFSINWGDAPCDAHIQNIKQIVENDLDVDVYWIDASWFGKNPTWLACTGDWDTIKKDKYHEEFKPLTDLLNKNNREFLLWFEPERVCHGTDFERLGDWLIELPTGLRAPRPWKVGGGHPDFPQKENLRNVFDENGVPCGDKLINFAIPEAVDYYIDFFTDFIKKHKIDFYRHDANIATGEYFKVADTEKRMGITEMKWIEGLYRFWDGLIENCPGLVIDNCSSGGRRIDLEMMDRSIVTTRTDCVWNENWKQNHGLGLNEWFTHHTCTEGVNLKIENRDNFEYDLVSNLSLGIMYNMTFAINIGNSPDDIYYFGDDNYDIPAIKDIMAKYRKLQPFFKYDYYPLTSYSFRDDAIVAYEFYSPEKDKGMVVLIKREKSPVDSATFELKGIKDKDYNIEKVIGDYDIKLMKNKLKVNFGEGHTACCIILN